MCSPYSVSGDGAALGSDAELHQNGWWGWQHLLSSRSCSLCFVFCSSFSLSLLFCTCKDTLSYVLAVEGRLYTIHLKQQFFLPADFSIYTYNETGSLRSDSPYIKGNCYYRGYIEGVPGSAVTLSTCMGLRGLLQFHNASYGIEPLGSSPSFQHVVYPVGSGAADGALLPHGHPRGRTDALAADSSSDTAQPALKLLSKHRRQVLLHVILERSLAPGG